MKMKYSFIGLFFIATIAGWSQEGMWIPSELDKVIGDMQAKGLKLQSQDLYSVTQPSLKDAVVWFDMGCTGEIVSNQGLLLTNHHCGFDYIQQHSSVENDYLTKGFWAMSPSEEKPCPGLTISMVQSIEEVTADVNGKMIGVQTEEFSKRLSDVKLMLSKEAQLPSGFQWEKEMRGPFGMEWQTKGGEFSSFVREYNYGTRFYRIVLKTYNDIRWVGAPPSDIGKFGGDTDNWVWPRHTGDFSVFRIYAGFNNEPAPYNAENKPYEPKKFFTVNAQGVHENDFTMIYGFPGRTEHFLPSSAIQFVTESMLPLRIEMREAAMKVLKDRMFSSDKVRIQYAAKQSSVANAYIKWKGALQGLTKYDAVALKKAQEEKLAAMMPITPAILIDSLYREYGSYLLANAAFSEFMNSGPELFRMANRMKTAMANRENWSASAPEKWSEFESFYKDFDPMTERDLLFEFAPLLTQKVSGKLEGQIFRDLLKENEDDWGGVLYTLLEGSLFVDAEQMKAAFIKGDFKRIENDPIYKTAIALYDQHSKVVQPKVQICNAEMDKALQQWVQVLSVAKDASVNWCDANSTLRIAYGKVQGSKPRDGVVYDYYTTTDGILQKYQTGNYDFNISPSLDSLYRYKIFGDYAENDQLRVCYTGSNHTTGGNSGSPALNAEGHLVGINFDRSWESTMSDYYFQPSICRNIMVDMRYVLWVIDVYANADHLIKEMNIVR